MPPVQSTPGEQHVAAGAPWVGEVYLLKNDHSIPDMPVEKVYPHRRTCCCVSQTTLNREVPRYSHGQEGHPIRLRFLAKGRACPTMYPLHRPPMLYPHVTRHKPNHHILLTLLALDPPSLPILLQNDLSHKPSTVCHLRLSSPRMERTAEHTDFHPDISLQSHPVEQANQDAKISLDPSRVRRYNHAIVLVEEGILMTTL